MKIISKEEVYKARYFRINKTVIERDGKTYTKDFIERNAAVFILPVDLDGNLRMLSQHRDAFDKRLLEIVAGTIEDSGDPLESAKRELQEETGLQANIWKKIATWEVSVNMNSPIHVFVATELTQGEAHPDEDEDIEQCTLSLAEAVESVLSGKILAASHAATILLYKELFEQEKL